MKFVVSVFAAGAFTLFAGYAHAQAQSNGCVSGASNCTGSNQNSGDITNPGTSNSASTQLGNSSASIASGTTIDTRPQVTQNANNTTSGTISGGNTSSGANASGNTSNNDNHSSVGNVGASSNSGPSTANSSSGGNILATGPSNASVGNTTSNSSGGAGGAGGSATGGTARASGGNASQGQKQGQNQAATANGTNTSRNSSTQGQSASLTGGNNTAALTGGAQSNGQNGGNQSTSVGGYSSSSRTDINVAPWLPANTPTILPGSNITVQDTACGPLMGKSRTGMVHVFHGWLWSTESILGYTDDFADVVDAAGQKRYYDQVWMPDGRIHLMGSRMTLVMSVNNTGTSRQIGVQVGQGQGAMGTNGAEQQQQVQILIRSCEAGILEPQPVAPAPVAVTPMPIIETPRDVLKRRIVRPRKIADCAPKK